MPAKLERQLAEAERSGASLIYTDRVNLGDRGDLPLVQSEVQPLFEGDVFSRLLLDGNHITVSSVLLDSEVFRSVGGFRLPHGAEDWELWMRVAENHAVAACYEPLVGYRFHKGMMSGDPRKMQKARRLAIDCALKLKRGQALPMSAKRRILSATANTNGCDAARRRAPVLAAQEFGAALWHWPFDASIYRNVARLVFGRW
jgi:hypothetical protein